MLQNSAEFTKKELELIFGKDNLSNLDDNLQVTGVSIDTRKIEKNNLFVPLNGRNIDAHNMIDEAIKSGAAASLVSKDWYEENKDELSQKPLIIVDDTLKALGKIANFHRKRFSLHVIAIGGSNGKTTTKEMICEILSTENKVLKTYSNFNNQLGVPLMLLQLDDSYDAAVLEIATNEPGEIPLLSEMIEPTHGLITNIGKEHLEKLIDIDGVEQEETFLFGYLRKFGGTAIVNYNDERLQKYAHVMDKKYVFGSVEGLHLTANIELDDELHPKIELQTVMNEKFEVHLKNLYGLAQAYNALAAIAVSLLLEMDIEKIKSAIENYKPDNDKGYGRMLVEKIGNSIIINDCYNANPSSVKIALDTLNKFDRNKIAVLGDMLELGDSSNEEHKEILEYAKHNADEVYTTGNEFKKLEDTEGHNFIENKKELLKILKERLNDTAVLVKGSRGMKLEEIIFGLKN